MFYAFILDNNLCLFEHANELIDMQLPLTLFIVFRMIINANWRFQIAVHLTLCSYHVKYMF